MQSNRTRIKNIMILAGSLWAVAGCNKLLEIDTPPNQLVTGNVFTDSAGASAAVNGLYSYIYNFLGNNTGVYGYKTTLCPALYADEMFVPSSTVEPFDNNALLPSTSDVANFWSNSYSMIYNANSILEGVQQAAGIKETIKVQLLAEAKFLRAFLYFHLVNYYGDVPLILTTNVSLNNVMGRAATGTVYEQIITDLKDAERELATDYTWSAGTRTRVNKATASALLARVYLYRGNWELAEQSATKVIDQSSVYQLQTDPGRVFLRASTEVLWQFYSNSLGYTWVANALIPAATNVQPPYSINTSLLNAFEAGDKRKATWIKVYNASYAYPFKDSSRTAGAGTQYGVAMRLAEQYLIRAEARTWLSKLTEARSDIDTLRHRAGLGNTPATTKETLITAIEQERRVELFCEWGHRWFDIKRTGRADAIMKIENPAGWNASDTLWPIPEAARSTNINLSQNGGYPL